MLRARERAQYLDCPAISAAAGALLQVLVVAARASAVVEIGTGAGVSSLYLARALPADGVLTTIDIEPEHQRAARETFADAGIRPNRTRVICGRAMDVLPRLTDGGYDLVNIDADPLDLPQYLPQALRLLRAGGVVAVHGALNGGKVNDPAQRDPRTSALRAAAKHLQEDPQVTCTLLPVDHGILLATLGPNDHHRAAGRR